MTCNMPTIIKIFTFCVGIAAVFTIFASFVFGSGIVYFVDSTAAGLRYTRSYA